MMGRVMAFVFRLAAQATQQPIPGGWPSRIMSRGSALRLFHDVADELEGEEVEGE